MSYFVNFVINKLLFVKYQKYFYFFFIKKLQILLLNMTFNKCLGHFSYLKKEVLRF